MKKILLMALVLLMGCAGNPYVKFQTINEAKRTKTETICTRKTYVIPFYVVVAAGFFTIEGDEVCKEVTTSF